MTSEAITTRQNQVSKAMDTTMPPVPLSVSPPSSLSTPSHRPSPLPSSPMSPSSPTIAVSPSIGASPPVQHQREKAHLAQPQQQREPSSPEDTHSPQTPQQREPSSPHLQRSHWTCKQQSMFNMDPSKKSYASIAALDLTEDTSFLLNPQLHHLLLTELGITDIQTCKAALSDPDTLTHDQVLLDPDIEEWKKSTHKEITQLESKDTWLKFQLQKPLPRFFQAHGYFITRELLQESTPSSRQDIVSEVTYKKTYQKPMSQLFLGAQSGLYLS